MDKTMLKQWTDDQIAAFANNAPSAWEARRLYDGMRKVRDDLQGRIIELERERTVAAQREIELLGDCIEFTISYGRGNEDYYRGRYRELTGKEYGDE